MFDDQPINNNQLPSNLPVGEPEDIFANTDDNIPVAGAEPAEVSVPPVVPTPPLQTAVGNGKLQPVARPERVSDTKITNPPLGEDIFSKKPKLQVMPYDAQDINKIKGPGLAKNLMIFLIIIIGVGIFGGGSWLVYSLFIRESAPTQPFVPADDFNIVNNEEIVNTESSNDNAIFLDNTIGEDQMVPEDQSQLEARVIDDGVLFGAPIDTDSDNLSDDIELEIGTDPNNWDTDKDGLSDGDEVLVWRSNPLKSDTDGDGYSDGAEVKNGYSPVGPGRIFDLGQ